MKQETIRAVGVPDAPPGSYSVCKKVGDMVYISGIVAWDNDFKPVGGNDAYQQSKTIFGYIQKLMVAAGGRMDDVIQLRMYTTDMRYQPQIWKARKESFSGDFPCSTLVCVSALFLPELVIEIEAAGVIGSAPEI
jgi:2-iminobutanoate/2-iminopropanoate deaminase